MPLDQNFLMWTLIVGFFVPILIAFIQQEHWNSRLRAAVMFVVCIIVALGTCYFQGKLHLDDTASVITSILLIVVTAIASYKGLWQPSNVAPQIEHLTSGIHVNDFHEKMALRAA